MTGLGDLLPDIETFSTVDIKLTGSFIYANHPSTGVHVMSYWFSNNRRMRRWYPHVDPTCPPEIAAAIIGRKRVICHNYTFERDIWRGILGPRFGWLVPADEQWDCTAIRAAAMSLPRSLELAGKAMKLPVEKDAVGQRIMLQLAKPRRWIDPPDRQVAVERSDRMVADLALEGIW